MKAVKVIAGILIAAMVVAGIVMWKLGKEPEEEKVTGSNETIALVNLDTGVTYGDRVANYSESFINSLSGEDVEKVTAGEAASGLEDGTYAAVITFPADLSDRVSRMDTMDTNKIPVTYEVSSDLKDKDEVAVREDIDRLYREFNDELSYAYVKSVLSDVEESQISVGKIFANNSGIIDAANTLSLGNYDSQVDFSTPPDIRVNPGSVEFGKFKWLQTDNKYASEIESAYAEGYKATYDAITPELTAAREKLTQDIEGAKTDVTTVTDWAGTVESEINAEKGKVSSVADEYEKALNEYADAYEEYIKKKNEAAEDGEEGSGDEDIKEPKIGDFITDALKSKLNNIGSSYTEKPETSLDKEAIASDLAAIEAQIAQLDPAVFTGNADSGVESKVKESNDALNADMKGLKTDFETTQSDNNSQYEKAGSDYDAAAKALSSEALAARTESEEKLAENMKKFLSYAESAGKDTRLRLEDFENLLASKKTDGSVSTESIQFMVSPLRLEEK